MTHNNTIAANREEENRSTRLKDLCKECGLDQNFRPKLGEGKADYEIPSLLVMLQQRRLVVEKMDRVPAEFPTAQDFIQGQKAGVEKHWTRTRLIDELLIWFRSFDIEIDEQTGHRRSKHERQAAFILYRVRLYKPPPVFVVNVSDFDSTDSRMYGPIMTLKKELLKLDLQTLDDVMKESIVRLFENIDERYYKLNINWKHISWEFKE